MPNQNTCEYNYSQCQKKATIQHYRTSTEGIKLSSGCWTCVNCWKVICQLEIK